MRRICSPPWCSQAGQSVVEYMLLISVITLGLWAAAQYLVPDWQSGLESMSGNVQGYASEGYVGGS